MVYLTMQAMTAVPTVARSSVRPMALNCSQHQRLKWRIRHVSLQVVGQVSIGAVSGQHAGQQRAEGSADGMHAEGVQRVVIAKPRL